MVDASRTPTQAEPGEAEVTEAMLEAGVSAWEKLGEAMEAREASDNPEELPDYDEGEVVTTIFRAMRAAALRTTTPAPRSVRVAELSDDDLEAIRAAEPSERSKALDEAFDEDALDLRMSLTSLSMGEATVDETFNDITTAIIAPLQASNRAKDAALLPLADEMEGLLPYLGAHHFNIDSLAKVVADARAALADTTKDQGQ